MKILDELERLADEATPGPWEATGEGYGWVWNTKDAPGVRRLIHEPDSDRPHPELDENNATFIAAADPPTVKALVRVARAHEWLINLHHDVSKNGSVPGESEWREAVVAGTDALDALRSLQTDE